MAHTRLLAVLTSEPQGPVLRHRWLVFAQALAAAGIHLEVVTWGKRGRRRALGRVATADGVVVSSRLPNVRDIRRIRRASRRLAFDFDDALPYRDSSRGARRSWTRSRRFRALVQAADLVLAGNRYLADLAASAGRGAWILPTVVSSTLDRPPPEPPPRHPVLGWIGSRATVPYLEALWAPLSALVTVQRPFRLRVVSDVAPSFPPGIAVDHVRWTLDGWRRDLAPIHVGLAPLPDDPWTRGKCGLKVIQMMSLGRPVVAAAVGVQIEQVEHGVTGYLARTNEEFLTALLTLLDDHDRRRAMGQAALEAVRRAWTAEAWAPRLVQRLTDWLA